MTTYGLPRISGAISILLALAAAANAQFTGAPGSPFPAGSSPDFVAVGDFNGDGHPDLAVANLESNNVTVLLGSAMGVFAAAPGSPFPVGSSPDSVAVGDFNGDGNLDLAVANKGDGTVTVLLGNGRGGFTAAGSPLIVGSKPYSVVAADFNGDGRLDLAVANLESDTVSILIQVPAVTISPSSLNFGIQLVGPGGGAPQTATLTNTGSGPLTISSIAVTGDASAFVETNTCGPNVAPGASCTISVIFFPTRPGSFSAAISISDNASGSPQTIALSGTGTIVKLSATSLNFGDVVVRKISSPQTAILTNVGTTTLSITSIHVTGTDKGDFSASNTCGKSVAAGGTCSIIVRFIPTEDGLRTATVDITDNGGGSPQTIRLSGTGT